MRTVDVPLGCVCENFFADTGANRSVHPKMRAVSDSCEYGYCRRRDSYEGCVYGVYNNILPTPQIASRSQYHGSQHLFLSRHTTSLCPGLLHQLHLQGKLALFVL